MTPDPTIGPVVFRLSCVRNRPHPHPATPDHSLPWRCNPAFGDPQLLIGTSPSPSRPPRPHPPSAPSVPGGALPDLTRIPRIPPTTPPPTRTLPKGPWDSELSVVPRYPSPPTSSPSPSSWLPAPALKFRPFVSPSINASIIPFGVFFRPKPAGPPLHSNLATAMGRLSGPQLPF